MTKYCPICRKYFKSKESLCPTDGIILFDDEDILVGRLIDGRYQILKNVGYGGMSSVYKAREESTGKIWAIKILSFSLASDPKHRARFARESNLAKRIDHENIIKTREVGETKDTLVFMVLEYLPGPTLKQYLAKGIPPLERSLQIAIQVARGLAHAHDLGIVHRDIKPENVMFVSENKVKLLDFGLAWMKGVEKLTLAGQVFGTPEYMSPEQATGSNVTPFSDLYSFGVLLYELLVGSVPFQGHAAYVMGNHLKRKPPPPSKVVSSIKIPSEVDRIVLKLLRKKPERRYRDAHHLIDDLTEITEKLYQQASLNDIQTDTSDLNSLKQELYPADSSDFYYLKENLYSPQSLSVIETLSRRWHHLLEGIYCQTGLKHTPKWLGPSLTQLASLLRKAQSLGEALKDDTESTIQREDDLRAYRTRLGSAIDIIAQEESRLKRDIMITKEKMKFIEDEIYNVKSRAGGLDPELEEQHELLCLDLERKTSDLKDFEFQLDQLRGRLGAMSAVHEHDVLSNKSTVESKSEQLEKVLTEFDALARKCEEFLVGV